MILVDASPVATSPLPGNVLLRSLLAHPVLQSTSRRLTASPERSFSWPSTSRERHVYVFQREYATVQPAKVQLIGSDEATTCVCFVIQNRTNGLTSISHMDFPEVVDAGLEQMLQSLSHNGESLDVHMVGAFEDVPTNNAADLANSRAIEKVEGHSWKLCCKIVEALHDRPVRFHLQTFCVLEHNTVTDVYGNVRPIVGGILVDTSSGVIEPANFDRSSRCPDEIVRRIRQGVAYEDPTLEGKLLEIYDTRRDQFCLAPIKWSRKWRSIAYRYHQLSDSEILLHCSTSPSAEPPHFVEDLRRKWRYLMDRPHWEQTFPEGKPRVFERTADGGWSGSTLQ